MAKKKSYKKSKAKGRGKAKGGASAVSGMWRLAIIVYAIVFFRALELFDIHSLEFLRTAMDAYGNSEYNLNFAVAGVSAAGFILLMCSKPSKTALTAVGAGMALLPAWLSFSGFIGGASSFALTLPECNPLNIVFSLSAVMWCVCMVRGGDIRARLIIGAVLIAENVWLGLTDYLAIDWYNLVVIDAFAVMLGLTVDYAYNGFSATTLLPAAAICAELMIWNWDSNSSFTNFATAAICGAGIIAIAVVPKLRKDSSGAAITLAGIAVNALLMLTSDGLLF